ncbi:MAG: hypothetical protein BWY88_01313 [Synergistetes bacterium ADurb.Bin520]|nr:MAG: hypothetical protein BWY88_01313 [Synergistetes bacterium ADurb.Bin520]
MKIPSARARAEAVPDTTVWTGLLWFAAKRPVRPEPRMASWTAGKSSPITAAMPGLPSGPSRRREAFSITSPRKRTSANTASTGRTFAAARAAYSPRLNPATPAGRIPRSSSAAAAARLTRVIAPWALSVARRSSSVPWKSSLSMSVPRASDAVRNSFRTEAWASKRSFPMPGCWAP